MEDRQQTPDIEERNATLDPDPVPVSQAMSDDELQDSLLEDSGMSGFQKFIARMDEQRWTLTQRIVGVALGLLAGVSLFWDSFSGKEEGFSYSLIIAVVIAMLVPNSLEKKGLRRIPKLRVALVITLSVMIVAYLILMGVRMGFKFTA